MKTSKLRVTGLCVGNSPVTGVFPSQMASNEENISIWWRNHGLNILCTTLERSKQPFILLWAGNDDLLQPEINLTSIGIRTWISNCIPHKYMDMISPPCPNLSKSVLVKGTPDLCYGRTNEAHKSHTWKDDIIAWSELTRFHKQR